MSADEFVVAPAAPAARATPEPDEKVQGEATKPAPPADPNPPGGMPYHQPDRDELAAVQAAQARHAHNMQLADLARRHLPVRVLLEEVDQLRARLAAIESEPKKKK